MSTNRNGNNKMNGITSLLTSAVESAIASADVYHGTGTTYLHTDNPLSSSSHTEGSAAAANPTGAVVPAISLATTFKQSTPGEPSARDDPNSFGMGYEYSRTGGYITTFAMCKLFPTENLMATSLIIFHVPQLQRTRRPTVATCPELSCLRPRRRGADD